MRDGDPSLKGYLAKNKFTFMLKLALHMAGPTSGSIVWNGKKVKRLLPLCINNINIIKQIQSQLVNANL